MPINAPDRTLASMSRPPNGPGGAKQCAYRPACERRPSPVRPPKRMRVPRGGAVPPRADARTAGQEADSPCGIQLHLGAMEHLDLAPHSGSSSRSIHVRRADLKRNARLKMTFAI